MTSPTRITSIKWEDHAKEASGRPQDKIDLDKLKEAEQLDALDEK
jgi:hypothetical protein